MVSLTAGRWWLAAAAVTYAVAVVAGLQMVTAQPVAGLTSPFKAGTAKCPGGRVAYSAGVTTSNTSRFGVQLVRTSGPLDIARATVRAFGTATVLDSWDLSTFAVCGPRQGEIVAAS